MAPALHYDLGWLFAFAALRFLKGLRLSVFAQRRAPIHDDFLALWLCEVLLGFAVKIWHPLFDKRCRDQLWPDRNSEDMRGAHDLVDM